MKYKKALIFLGSTSTIIGSTVGLILVLKKKKENPKPKIFDLKDDISKIKDFKTTDSIKSKIAFAKEGDIVTSLFEKITGFKEPNFSKGVSISSVKVKTPLKNKKVIYSITLTKKSSDLKNNTKDISVTFGEEFDFQLEKDKFKDLKSIDSAGDEKNDLSKDEVNADITTKFNKLSELRNNKSDLLKNSLSEGVTISKVTISKKYDPGTKSLKAKIFLHKDGVDKMGNNEKEITISFEYHDMQKEIDKIQDFTTENLADKEDNDFTNLKAEDDVKEQFDKIPEALSNKVGSNLFKTSQLGTNTQIDSIKVKTPYDAKTKTMVVTVTLEHKVNKRIKHNEKEITITFATPTTDLNVEIQKLKSFITKDKANADGNDFTSKKVDDDVTAMFKDISEVKAQESNADNKQYPYLTANLSEGVSIEKVEIKTAYKSSNKKLKVTITLTKEGFENETNNEKDIEITFG